MTYFGAGKYSLPLELRRSPLLCSQPIDPSSITVVIPVKDDLPGLICSIRSLLCMKPRPRAIRVVDDGSQIPVSTRAIERLLALPLNCVHVRRLERNRGPACARNEGARDLTGWMYFTDCGCKHPTNLFNDLAFTREQSDDHNCAIGTPIVSLGNGRISRYMSEQGNLNPPVVDKEPQAVITASVVVFADAASKIGWFDPRFRVAGGEDIDFGLRLAQVGQIAWSPNSIVQHDFDECNSDFRKRFRRYGEGLRTLAMKWRVSLKPFEFDACSKDLQDLAELQYLHMLEGYTGA